MKDLKLWLAPAGVGFGTLLTIIATDEIPKISIIIFISSIVLWLLSEFAIILYRKSTFHKIRYAAKNYEDVRLSRGVIFETGKCICCNLKNVSTISLGHKKIYDCAIAVCLRCYQKIEKEWAKEKPKTRNQL